MPNWTDVNAYVDGELDPEAAADVARAVADDREVAGRVAALARLKAVSAEVMAVPPDALPALRIARRTPAPRRRRSHVAAAAAVVLALAAGGLWERASRPDPVGAWLERVEGRHALWLEADAAPAPAAGPVAAIAGSGFEGSSIPDLGPMRLEVAHVASFAPTPVRDGRHVLHVGYVGINGCRLSLWIGPAPPGLPAELAEHREDGAQILSWRVGDTGYAAVARGMDADRLKAVARYVEERSRGTATRLAGMETRGSGAPCLG